MLQNNVPSVSVPGRDEQASCNVTGQGLLHAVANQLTSFVITSNNGVKLQLSDVEIGFTGSAEIEHTIEECQDGSIVVNYISCTSGDVIIRIVCGNVQLPGSPFRLQCAAPKAEPHAETRLRDAPGAQASNVDFRMRGGGLSEDDMAAQGVQHVTYGAVKAAATESTLPAKAANKFNPSKQAKWHMDLRAKILKTHPEVRDLYGPYPLSFALVVTLFVSHWGIAYLLRDSSLWLIALVASTVGMTLFHAQGSILHDSAHRLVFSSEPWATLCDLLIELTFTSFAETTSYSNGHTQRHHIYLGDYPNDNEIPDLCSHFSGVQLKAKTPLGEKILFGVRMVFAVIPLSFLLDPLVVDAAAYFIAPHIATADIRRDHPIPWKTQVKMVTFQVLSGVTIALGFYFLGWRAMMYHFLCLSFETNAFVSVWRTGQDVAEHNPNEDARPTNSHYYWLYNFLFLNTGYHNEHHTFPQVAGPRLPLLKKLAPEYFTSEIKTSYFSLFLRQLGSHFESYRVSTSQETSMGSDCMKSAQAVFAKQGAEKAAKMAALSRNVKAA